MVTPSKFVRELEAYRITPQDVWSDAAPADLLKLDWNEAPEDFDFYRKEIRRVLSKRGSIAWYPDCLALQLTDALSDFLSVEPSSILSFPGSDVALEVLCRAYLGPGDCCVVIVPSYENFFVYALQTGARLHRFVTPPPFVFDRVGFARELARVDSAKVVYLVRPNNPCGYVVGLHDVEGLARQFQSTLFVVDEAYIEFSESRSCVGLVGDLPNLVVSRTFSKAFGMAGLRLGYLCAHPDILEVVNKIRNGKNVSMLAQWVGVYALRHRYRVEGWVEEVRRGRELFYSWCSAQKVEAYRSEGNFVLMKVRRPVELCSALKAEGVFIRNRSESIPGCVRVTIGSAAHVRRLIGVLSRNSSLL
jgi:histidinol-phosphate aminotransferase